MSVQRKLNIEVNDKGFFPVFFLVGNPYLDFSVIVDHHIHATLLHLARDQANGRRVAAGLQLFKASPGVGLCSSAGIYLIRFPFDY